MKIILFIMALSCSVFALEPVRPTYRDVSLKVIEDEGYPYRWYRGKNATQIEKDAIEETLLAVALPESIRFARTIPACLDTAKKAANYLDSVTAKLGPIYEDHSLKQGLWEIPESGRHYLFERYGLMYIRDCAVSTRVAPLCAASPLMTQNLQELLNIRIEGGKCIKGNNNFTVIAPTEAYATKLQRSFPVQADVKMPALTEAQMHALHETHAAHKAVSDFRCGVGPNPGNVVDPRHQDLERLARDGSELHFFMMKRFSGFVDGWSPEIECKIARQQDRAHESWMNAVMAGDWRASRAAENDHQQSHIILGLNFTNYRLLPFWTQFDEDRLVAEMVTPEQKAAMMKLMASCKKDVSNCPKFSVSEYMNWLP